MVRISDELKRDTPTMAGLGVGDVLGGQFRIDELLGRGGMGEVFRGFDVELERVVAIKVLPAFLMESKRAAKALRREAARAIELAHEALARIYHFGVQDGLPFMVMEHIGGGSLDDLLDARERLEVEEAVRILEPLAAGLDHAHRKGVVHRDVKPANILLRAEGGAPVLIDFGISAEVRDQTTRATGTELSQTVGTLSYMSPEQIRGRPPSPSMDVYSLAATAHEMLSGEPPFFRGDPLNVQYQILHELPPRLEGVLAHVAEAVARGLAKDPGERFASASELVRALREGGGVPEAGPPAEGGPAAEETVLSTRPEPPGEDVEEARPSSADTAPLVHEAAPAPPEPGKDPAATIGGAFVEAEPEPEPEPIVFLVEDGRARPVGNRELAAVGEHSAPVGIDPDLSPAWTLLGGLVLVGAPAAGGLVYLSVLRSAGLVDIGYGPGEIVRDCMLGCVPLLVVTFLLVERVLALAGRGEPERSRAVPGWAYPVAALAGMVGVLGITMLDGILGWNVGSVDGFSPAVLGLMLAPPLAAWWRWDRDRHREEAAGSSHAPLVLLVRVILELPFASLFWEPVVDEIAREGRRAMTVPEGAFFQGFVLLVLAVPSALVAVAMRWLVAPAGRRRACRWLAGGQVLVAGLVAAVRGNDTEAYVIGGGLALLASFWVQYRLFLKLSGAPAESPVDVTPPGGAGESPPPRIEAGSP